MAGRPHKMAERVDRLEGIAYALLTRLDEAMPEMYKPGRHGPRGRPDTLARLWQRAAGDMGEAYGSLRRRCLSKKETWNRPAGRVQWPKL